MLNQPGNQNQYQNEWVGSETVSGPRGAEPIVRPEGRNMERVFLPPEEDGDFHFHRSTLYHARVIRREVENMERDGCYQVGTGVNGRFQPEYFLRMRERLTGAIYSFCFSC